MNLCSPYHVTSGRRSSLTAGPATLRPSACTLQHITVSPSKIGDIARAAHVLDRPAKVVWAQAWAAAERELG